MKHYGLEVPEQTSGIVNLTTPVGTSFPSLENSGELFFRTDEEKLYVHGTTEWIDLVGNTFSWPLEAPDGTAAAPSYSWENETDSGFYRSAPNTISVSIEGSDLFHFRRTGSPAGAGIDLHIKNDLAGDSQIRVETDTADKDSIIQLITASGLWKITHDETDNNLEFSFGSTVVFNLEFDGTLSVPATSPNYAELVINDNDIPNKKYVDDAITAGAFTHPDPHLLGNGSVSAPTYSFTSSSSTGMYHSGSGDLGISTLGTRMLRLHGGLNYARLGIDGGTNLLVDTDGSYASLDVVGTTVLALSTTYQTLGVSGDSRIIVNQSSNTIDFYGGSSKRLAIEADGTLNVSGTTNYETLVTADDDITNKKYVDDAITAGSFTHPDPHLLSDGSESAPTYSFSTDSTSGLYYEQIGSPATFRKLMVSLGGEEKFQVNAGTNTGIEIDSGGSGNRSTYIDFHSDDTNIDYSTRIIRQSGSTGKFVISNAGGGFTEFTNKVKISSGAPILAFTEDTGGSPQYKEWFLVSDSSRFDLREDTTAGENRRMSFIDDQITQFFTSNTERLRIDSIGTLSVIGTTDYEDLVTSDDDIPNKKYVDDAITTSVGDYLPLAGGTMSGDITMDGNSILTADNVQGTGELTFTGDGTHHVGDTRIEKSYIELGYFGTGYRNCYIDFHNQGTFGGSPYIDDFNARIIKYPPDSNNGNFFFQNLYEGNVQIVNSVADGKVILTSDVGTTPEVRFVTAASGSISTYVGGVLQTNLVANQIQIQNGNATAPSLSFISDTDTGLYWVGANQLAIATAGTQAISVKSNQDVTLSGNLVLSNHIETGSAGSKTRYFNGGFSTTISPATIYELGRFNITGVSTNQTVTGQITGGTSQQVGVTDFIIQIRSNSPLTSKTFSFSQTKNDLGREVEVQVYNQPDSGDVVLAYVASDTLQNINWTISIAERADYNYFTEVTGLTGFDPNGSPAYTEITETADYISISTGRLRINEGSESEPSYSFDGDENTGMYGSDADELSLTAGGTRQMQVSDGRVSIDNILSLPQYTMSGSPNGIPDGQVGDVIYVSNGDSGNPCIAIHDGSSFKRISLGTTISPT